MSMKNGTFVQRAFYLLPKNCGSHALMDIPESAGNPYISKPLIRSLFDGADTAFVLVCNKIDPLSETSIISYFFHFDMLSFHRYSVPFFGVYVIGVVTEHCRMYLGYSCVLMVFLATFVGHWRKNCRGLQDLRWIA
jgi:hypothetical protein